MSNNKKIKIENGLKPEGIIPGHRRYKYPMKLLKIGESFFVASLNSGSVWLSLYVLSRKYKPKVFRLKKYHNGVRVWRIKPGKQKQKSSFNIERGIQIPEPTRGTKFPFAILEIKESFFVKGERPSLSKLRARLSTIAIQHTKTSMGKGKEFILRTYNDGIRMWRVK